MKIIKVGSTKLTGHVVREPIDLSVAGKIKLAERFRNKPTESERLLNNLLIKDGVKFKFQHILHGYIADFFFPGKNYIVELDGSRWHNADKDADRDANLLRKGIRTLRIPSQAMFTEPAIVLREIKEVLKIKKARKARRKARRHAVAAQKRADRLQNEFMFATEGI
jgi:very-short-patch-repair endonuclease